MKIHTHSDLPPDEPLTDFGPSKTRAEFLEESDINNILDQYNVNGILPDTKPEGLYGDFTDPALQDFALAQNIVVGAKALFDALPAKTRERFSNDPASLIAFVQDDANYDEAVRLGLIDAKPAKPAGVATPAAAPVAEPATPLPAPAVKP